jgi:hypothetical protein
MYTRAQIFTLLKMVESGVLPIGERAGMRIAGEFGLEEWQQAFEIGAQQAGPGTIAVIKP